MSFPRYPKYKDSGVEWLGEVPAHWEVKRLRFAAELNPSKSEVANLDRETPVSFLPMESIGDDGTLALNQEKTIGELESGYTYFRDGDVTVAKITPCYENGKGALMCGLTNGIGFGTTELIVARPKPEHVTGPYLHYLFISPDFRGIGESHMYGAGGQKRVPDAFVRNFATAFPPLSEQTAIAGFLDRETGKIDELVAEQRRLMELLNEQIISLVLYSFQAPETKELRLSEASTIISRSVVQKADESYTRIGLFNRGRGLFHKDESEMDDMGESDFFWIEEGDLIISGQFAWEGAVALADKEDTGCVVSHRYPVIRGKAGVALTEYLFGLLCTKHGDFLLNENSRGAAGRNRPLNISSLMKEKIPVPDMGIQEAVARAVHAKKTLFKEITKATDLLQERRTALISAAVTGQIDVRNSVASDQVKRVTSASP
jgi:type I restriction enzyme, S subunit